MAVSVVMYLVPSVQPGSCRLLVEQAYLDRRHRGREMKAWQVVISNSALTRNRVAMSLEPHLAAPSPSYDHALLRLGTAAQRAPR